MQLTSFVAGIFSREKPAVDLFKLPFVDALTEPVQPQEELNTLTAKPYLTQDPERIKMVKAVWQARVTLARMKLRQEKKTAHG